MSRAKNQATLQRVYLNPCSTLPSEPIWIYEEQRCSKGLDAFRYFFKEQRALPPIKLSKMDSDANKARHAWLVLLSFIFKTYSKFFNLLNE